MNEIVFHPITRKQLNAFMSSDSHALLLQGGKGSGKSTFLINIAAELLQLNPDKVIDHPSVLHIKPDDKKAIKIEAIRRIDHFLGLRVSSENKIQRLVLIDDAEHISEPAQNALLKNLEEPPLGTVFILTSAQPTKLLPTLRSRMTTLNLHLPEPDQLKLFFSKQPFDQSAVERALMLSNNSMGLALEILNDPKGHELVKAAEMARSMLAADKYQRLVTANTLAKDQPLLAATVTVIGTMAKTALSRGSDSQAERWRHVLTISDKCERYLQAKTNAKLTATYLALYL